MKRATWGETGASERLHQSEAFGPPHFGSEGNEGLGAEWGVLRRLDDRGAARGERGAGLTGDHGDGEIPRGDERTDPDRLVHHHDALVGRRRRENVAVDALGLLRKPRQERRTVGHCNPLSGG